MTDRPAILLCMSDRPVLSSLQFALTIDGYDVIDGTAAEAEASVAAALVIDQGFRGDGLAALLSLRAAGCGAPAILLATHPDARLRARAAAAGTMLVEKPLMNDELGEAIARALLTRKVA
jgi:FixJ family two-component response regulator